MKDKLLIILFICILFKSAVAESQFEELDKPPEGAHEGQIFLGVFVSIGLPSGDLITEEENFVKGSVYTFDESEITKELLVTHLSYDFGLSFEYMPIDHVGIKTKLKRAIIVQRTIFGADFQNWSETLYSNYSILLGPAFHLTNRKQWDVTFTPIIGYAYAKYAATPIAADLISGYGGDRKRDVNGMTYGAELNLTIYFSGGLYISIGTDWNKYSAAFSPPLSLVNPDPASNKMNKSSGNIQTINLAISAGYAFAN